MTRMMKIKWGLSLVVTGGLLMGAGFAGEIRVRGLSLVPGEPKGDVFLHDGKLRPVGVKIRVRSFLNHEFDLAKVRGDFLVFSREARASSVEEGEKLLGSVKLPAQFRSGVFLFTPRREGETAAVRLIDDSFSSFPAGAIKVVNLSPDAMRIELEGERFECAAGAEIVIPDPPVDERNASGMRAYRQKDGDWVQVTSGVWSHPGRKRVIQVITINPVIRRIEIKGFRDISSPPRR